MPKCPKCKKEIEQLRNYCQGENVYSLWLEGNDIQYDLKDFIGRNENEYCCPECHEVIFTDEEEAIKFLKENK